MAQHGTNPLLGLFGPQLATDRQSLPQFTVQGLPGTSGPQQSPGQQLDLSEILKQLLESTPNFPKGAQARADIKTRSKSLRGASRQRLVSSGLANSTVSSSVDLAHERELNSELRRFDESRDLMKLGFDERMTAMISRIAGQAGRAIGSATSRPSRRNPFRASTGGGGAGTTRIATNTLPTF